MCFKQAQTVLLMMGILSVISWVLVITAYVSKEVYYVAPVIALTAAVATYAFAFLYAYVFTRFIRHHLILWCISGIMMS